MASKKTLNAKNLEALGAERLAGLLMELGTGDAALKRRLRMELAAEDPGELARQIRKRLTSIKSYLFHRVQVPLDVAVSVKTQPGGLSRQDHSRSRQITTAQRQHRFL